MENVDVLGLYPREGIGTVPTLAPTSRRAQSIGTAVLRIRDCIVSRFFPGGAVFFRDGPPCGSRVRAYTVLAGFPLPETGHCPRHCCLLGKGL